MYLGNKSVGDKHVNTNAKISKAKLSLLFSSAIYQMAIPAIAIIKLGDSTALLNMVVQINMVAKNNNLYCGPSICGAVYVY